MIRPRTTVRRRDVARHYDDLDPFYRGLWGEHVHHGYWSRRGESAAMAADALADLVASRLRLQPGDHLCDVGCGYGATARRVSARHAVAVTGVTISPAQASLAAARAGDGARPPHVAPPRFLLMDWLHNGFTDAAFDAAMAVESSEHMASLPAFFAELFRTLKPGGRVVVCAWLSASSPSAWQIRCLLEPICREGRLAGLGTRREYSEAMTQAGFGETAFEDITAAVSRTWSVCLRRLALAIVTNRDDIRAFLRDRSQANRAFALTVARIRLAYLLGALRYGVFTATKPRGAPPASQSGGAAHRPAPGLAAGPSPSASPPAPCPWSP